MRVHGWRTEGDLPFHIPRFVIIGAPHTSNWDYYYALICAYGSGLLAHWPYGVMIKDAAFRTPVGPIMSAFGGIPVDRSAGQLVVDQMVAVFHQRERLMLALSPEGTRQFTEYWKTGFYRIAQSAQVPLVMAALDYGRKLFRISAPFRLTGDNEADLNVIRAFYAGAVPKFPNEFGPIQFKEKT